MIVMMVVMAPTAPPVAVIVVPAAMPATPAAIVPAMVMVMAVTVAPIAVAPVIMHEENAGLRREFLSRHRLRAGCPKTNHDGEADGEGATALKEGSRATCHDDLPIHPGRETLRPVSGNLGGGR